MTRMVRVAVAADATEAEEIQALLSEAGIESELERGEGDSVAVMAPEDSVETAQDAIELAESDELVGEP